MKCLVIFLTVAATVFISLLIPAKLCKETPQATSARLEADTLISRYYPDAPQIAPRATFPTIVSLSISLVNELQKP